MKKFIFVLLIALSCSAAIAESPSAKISGDTFDIFKAPPSSSIIKSSPEDQLQCTLVCFQKYRNCLGNSGTGDGYWKCELRMEQCTADCLD